MLHHSEQGSTYASADYQAVFLVIRRGLTLPTRSAASLEAVEDSDQSGRCLAFDSYTASGSHMIRAAETVIFDDYL